MVEEGKESYILMTLGNPLLDISVEVKEDSPLKKYSLKVNDTVLAQEHHMPLYDELQKMENCMFIPGGSGLNSLRCAQVYEDIYIYIYILIVDLEGEISKMHSLYWRYWRR